MQVIGIALIVKECLMAVIILLVGKELRLEKIYTITMGYLSITIAALMEVLPT